MSISHIIISSLLSLSLVARTNSDTLFLDLHENFVIEISVVDTIHTDVKMLVEEEGKSSSSNARLLIIKVDSVLKINNRGIYSDDLELKAVKYLAVPIHIKFPREKNLIITTISQRSKEYFVYGRYLENNNITIVDWDPDIHDGYGYSTGLARVTKANFFWYFLYYFGFISENLYLERAFNSKKQPKDPIQKAIRKYEKKNN